MMKETLHDRRRNMVAAVRQGRPQRPVAIESEVALSTLQWGLARAGTDPLDQVDWSTHSRAPGRAHNGTSPEVELAVLACRQRLATTSAPGFYGAQTIADTYSDRDVLTPGRLNVTFWKGARSSCSPRGSREAWSLFT